LTTGTTATVDEIDSGRLRAELVMLFFSQVPGSSLPLMITDAFMNHFIAVGPLFFFIFYIAYGQLTYKPQIPSNIPWIGKDSSKLFAETRAMIPIFGNVRKWLAEGYKKACPWKPFANLLG
jgi:hypothetical protein